MKKKLIIAAVLVVVAFGCLLFVTRTFFPTNIADTSPDHSEEMLRTRRYKTDLAAFTAATENMIPTLTKYGSNWKFISTEKTDKGVLIKAEVPVLVFTDDLTVKAETDPADSATLIVNVHSNSRVGKSDFGENRRHLLTILGALDEKLGRK